MQDAENTSKRAEFQIDNLDGTRRFGRILAEILRAGDVVGLRGDLGAGKTFLSGAVAYALNVPPEVAVTSPTFVLINEYEGSLPIYHMDLYRLGDADEIYDLGLWEYYDGDGVCLVEWCDRFDDLWPKQAVLITLELLGGEERRFVAEGRGRGAEIVAALSSAY